MNHTLLWLTTAVLGAAATLMMSLGLAAVVVVLLLTVPLIIRGDRFVAVSGLLTGFGGFWMFLMARQGASGGRLDDAQYWAAVGILPFAVGSILLLAIFIREFSRRDGGTSS